MLLYSNYLMQEVELECQTVTEEGKDFYIISHDALMQVIYQNPICRANAVRVEFHESATNNARHHVWSCVISDNAGRRVEEIGESTYMSLTTNIAKAYPSLMAHKRAFDAAALIFLDLPANLKFYSDEQFSNFPANPVGGEVALTDENVPNAAPVDEPDIPQNVQDETPVPETPQEAAPVAHQKAETPPEEANPMPDKLDIDSKMMLESVDEEAALNAIIGEEPPKEMWQEGAGDTVDLSKFDVEITFGRHKGKTIRQIYKADAGYIAWLKDKARDATLRQLCAEYEMYMKQQEKGEDK